MKATPTPSPSHHPHRHDTARSEQTWRVAKKTDSMHALGDM